MAPEEHEHDIQHNIKNDRDLDRRVQTNITVDHYNALKTLADIECDGNVSELVRALIDSALRQRYLI